MCIYLASRECIQWWIDTIVLSFRTICLPQPHGRISSDSSGMGWGWHDVTYDVKRQGQWPDNYILQHINYLELKVAFQALQSLCHNVSNEHVHIYLDNTTAIKYLSKIGGQKPHLNNIAREICFGERIGISG